MNGQFPLPPALANTALVCIAKLKMRGGVYIKKKRLWCILALTDIVGKIESAGKYEVEISAESGQRAK